MRKVIGRGCREAAGIARLAGLVLLVAACTPRTEAPAPVLDRNAATTQPEEIEVRRGQTLSGIAHAYHVPMQVLAEANHLSPPYRIETGQTLIIPVAGQPAIPSPPASLAALPPALPEAPAVPGPPEAANFDGPSHIPAGKPPTAEASPAPAVAMPPPPPAAAAPQERAATPAQTGGTFLWPVRGRVLAGYGSGRDGTHNDGINIAAPRGTPVEAVDAGTVAYTGNELRGYGNLLLVKHLNGWISAYAHCDLILVKRGDKVARGQVIARVGSTGNVGEPQLHFELRRGSRAVDPREFLAPVPTATSKERSGPG